jgi:4-amino-4-deoxy-L-arabinose transferase-like glycosyltransferase
MKAPVSEAHRPEELRSATEGNAALRSRLPKAITIMKSSVALPTWAAHACAVLMVAAIAHLSFYSATPVIAWLDSVRYVVQSFELPRRLATGDWDLWTTPAYPFFLWLVRPWTGSVEVLVLIQQCLAVATCLLVWVSARKMFGARAALLSSVLVALSPFRHYYAQTILSEQLAELLLVAGFTALTLAIDAPLARFLVRRALGGIALGLAVLTRPNLAPAAALAMLTPIPPRAAMKRGGLLLGMLLTAVTTTSVVAPWLDFNAQRGVSGFTGNVGFALNLLANQLNVGTPIDLDAAWRDHTAERDRELVGVALGRFTSTPGAYLRAVARTAVTLFVPLYVASPADVSPFIGLCQTPPHVARILASAWPGWAGFAPAKQQHPARWRCDIHNALMPPFALLTTAGWIGLAAWIIISLLRARFDLALLASGPAACLFALCPVIQANNRYAFPCEALALGVGVPAGIVLLRRREQRSLPVARVSAAPSRSDPPRRSLMVHVEAGQGSAAPHNDAPANFLVVVTDPVTGAGVTSLRQENFQVIDHFAVPGRASTYDNNLTAFSNVGTGAYHIQVRPKGCTWVSGDYLTQVIVSAPAGKGQATATLSIR